MIEYLKYIALIIVCGTIIYAITQVRSCSANVPPSIGKYVQVPKDTSFAPVTRDSYQPPSLPFSDKKLGVHLPAGVSERDVKQVTTIEVQDVPKSAPKRIDIIETQSGKIFVARDSSIRSVTVTTVEPPLFVFSLRFGAGVSLSQNRISPSAVFSPLEWSGWIQAPIVTADLDGLGAGTQFRIYHDISLGAVKVWNYTPGSEVKLTIHYMF